MNTNMNILVLGAGGFIGSHMVKSLKDDGHWVRGVDLKYPEFTETLLMNLLFTTYLIS